MQQFRVGNKRAERPQIKKKKENRQNVPLYFAVCPKKDDIYRATRSCWGARESDDDRICSRQRKKWGAILLCRLLPNKLTTTFPPFHFSVFFFVFFFLFYFRHFTHTGKPSMRLFVSVAALEYTILHPFILYMCIVVLYTRQRDYKWCHQVSNSSKLATVI